MALTKPLLIVCTLLFKDKDIPCCSCHGNPMSVGQGRLPLAGGMVTGCWRWWGSSWPLRQTTEIAVLVRQARLVAASLRED